MDQPLHPDDLVARKGAETELGVVERTHADVDTHEPHPDRNEEQHIKHDPAISQAAFRKFLRDGIPPQRSVLVRWASKPAAQLISESKVKLIDRSLLVGDIVKKDSRDAMSGVVINTFTKCTLQPLSDVTYKGKHKLKGLLPPTTSDLISQEEDDKAPVMIDIPALELKYAETPTEDDLVLYKDWIGRVEASTCNVALKLVDGCVVEVSDEFAEHSDGTFDAFYVGDVAITKKSHLRNGKWIFGQYNPNTPAVGTVVQTRLVEAEILWLQRRIGSKREEEPPMTLERDEFESDDFHVYDRTRRPARSGSADPVTLSNSEIDVRLGLRVRFNDLSGACVKYDGSSPHGKLSRIDRKDTLGYDLNVYDVVHFTTEVTVQWQDLSMSRHRSVELVPDTSIDDEHAAWPGEIAYTLDVHAVPGLEHVQQPGKVGVIQSVNAAERMAQVRWAPQACIQYTQGEDGVRSLLTGAVGHATGPDELVSLYDVETPGSLNVRRGDIVLVTKQEESAPGRLNWLGEIVDTCLDGTLVVRLGAASPVREIKLRREDCIVAVRSDLSEGEAGGGWDENFEDVLEAAEREPEGPASDVVWRNRIIDRDDDESEEDSDVEEMLTGDEDEEEPQASYEDENGEPLDEDDVEDGDWESDEGDEDTEMPDAPQDTPPTSHSVTPSEHHRPHAEQITNGGNSGSQLEDPEPYMILDAVPDFHHYFSLTPSEAQTHMKRTQKEHKILRSPDNLPKGVYVRSWETRLDLLRVLFIGPENTPYQHAPFIIDFHLPDHFPSEPPKAHFYSWTGDSSLGGVGRVNPNLYEDGTICLSLLGTWEGNKGEGWNASRSTLLQVIVSILGLVLVKEPYFNEAGYEHLVGLEASKRPSALYSERTYLRARTFITTALSKMREAKPLKGLEGFEGVLKALYWDSQGLRLVDTAVKDLEDVLQKSEGGDRETDGLSVMSKGACIPLRRILERLKQLQ